MKFRFNEKVIIKNGFYRGFGGRVIRFEEVKIKMPQDLFNKSQFFYDVKIVFEDHVQIERVNENDLRASLF